MLIFLRHQVVFRVFLLKHRQNAFDHLQTSKQNIIKVHQYNTSTIKFINKNRIVKKWKENDIVFVLDRLQIPGNPRPLKLRFNPSPYLVVRCLYSTSLLRRNSDGFMALYSNDHLKKYSGADPIFATLPAEINKILLNDFQKPCIILLVVHSLVQKTMATKPETPDS